MAKVHEVSQQKIMNLNAKVEEAKQEVQKERSKVNELTEKYEELVKHFAKDYIKESKCAI